jgi:hypothetical protein
VILRFTFLRDAKGTRVGTINYTIAFAALSQHQWPGSYATCTGYGDFSAEASTARITASLRSILVTTETTSQELSLHTLEMLSYVSSMSSLLGRSSDEPAQLVDLPAILVACGRPVGGNNPTPFALPSNVLRVLILRKVALLGNERLSLDARDLVDEDDELPWIKTTMASATVAISTNAPLQFDREEQLGLTPSITASLWLVEPPDVVQTVSEGNAACRDAAASSHAIGQVTADDGNFTFGGVQLAGRFGASQSGQLLLCVTALDVLEAASGAQPARSDAVAIAAVRLEACTRDGDCGRQGVCDSVAHQCRCNERTRGYRCEIPCPTRATDGAVCHGRGVCNAQGTCDCHFGFAGRTCSAKRLDLQSTPSAPSGDVALRLRMPSTRDSPEAASETWQFLQLRYVSNASHGVELVLSPVQLVTGSGRRLSFNFQAIGWLDAYLWCDAAAVGTVAAAHRHFENSPRGFGVNDAPQLAFVLDDNTAQNCSCAGSNIDRSYCLGVYFTSSIAAADRSLENEGVIFAEVNAHVRVVTTTPNFTELLDEDCDASCVGIRAAVGVVMGMIGVIAAVVVIKRVM